MLRLLRLTNQIHYCIVGFYLPGCRIYIVPLLYGDGLIRIFVVLFAHQIAKPRHESGLSIGVVLEPFDNLIINFLSPFALVIVEHQFHFVESKVGNVHTALNIKG